MVSGMKLGLSTSAGPYESALYGWMATALWQSQPYTSFPGSHA